ncbi:wiskott-Aldrich syndrome protein homolog 1-like [Hyposmocoma kahamanoa]|uniref:wiskott-Aldrich syndrome protein homolog 1-like n=1 Tax=Hyposmocoma kahamanoa TaxID=1477025 RepID=UPI000E6D8BA9|nr:wiskott-Aldrich syndrome protein homolog 1-like [Hyposmocoma kahamanoa]
MNYGRAPTRPIAIVNARPPPPIASSPDDRRRRPPKENRTPLGSQTIFPLSLDSPASPPELDSADVFEEDPPHHPLTTVREMSEDGSRQDGRRSPEVSSSPSYVKLAYGSKPIAAPVKTPEVQPEELSCNPTATKTLARIDNLDIKEAGAAVATVVLAGSGSAALRFSVGEGASPPLAPLSPLPAPPLNYAALDLEPRPAGAAPPGRTYTQIDFVRSEKLHADAN